MLWKWFSIGRIASHRMLKMESLASFRSLCSQIQCFADTPQGSFSSSHYQKFPENPRIILTPTIVRTTISNCRSDILAFSFFLWCARQPNYFHDRGTLTLIVSIVSRLMKRCRTVKGIIKGLEEVGCVIKPQTLLFLLRIYWFGGMYDRVFEAFEEILRYGYTPNTFSRNIVMDVLFKIERVEVALRVLKETEVPNFLSYSIAVCNLCKLNDLVNLQDVLTVMLRKRYYPNEETFFVILHCYCKGGCIAEAIQILGLMIVLGVPICERIWSILIDVHCKAGNMDAASHLLKKMVESGYSPNVVTCTSLIKGFFESQMPSKAFGILDTMESKGCSPDLVLCNVLIHCLSKMGRYEDAINAFFHLREQRLTPDSYTLCSLITTVCLSKQFVELPLLITGFKIQPDLVACNSFLSYFCKAGYPAGAIEFYNDMIDRGFVADKYTFAGLLTGLCRSGRIGEAVKVYHGLVRSHVGLDSHIITVIINGLIKSGKFHKAISLIREAASWKSQLDDVSYTIAISGLLIGGEVREAYALFRQMKEVGLAPSKQTYNLILSDFCKRSDFSMVEEILLEMVNASVEVDHLSLSFMKNLLYRSRHSASLFTLLTDVSTSGILPREAYAELIDEIVHQVNISNVHTDRSTSVDFGSSSSDEILEVAVSVG
ncbi:putative pentatricopeptide repeat-containing protein At1g16830 [Solanum pennellii]|uniref:Pentatricopeptide repeat-containing protein At1g16830 n=1 Tax=Solanum pennellii TaxID=28526 RepID=A0ABM1FUT0_SOLPN|nr:putative pentatricopeptide repeat-containing protein At1g16830 [Solanum pennellii]XP_015062007.1 putative pentatricopeptide repeat-containing protein At1g16830 [Solanum pennellii]XP_015062015.1 putative pentatricopeptide repeat-containing protein At1g16830 [Solanum pennellii]XP_027770425.1 putative pentatricopeptide repeat-containing protein At1g16830 [Solanum pennellii]XP_027770426.1 putative pentatricopeptide repeat-containing protein At1g16830 [Solanum pennellii]